MKFASAINYLLRFLGIKVVRLSSLEKLQVYRPEINNTDIEKDADFMQLYRLVKEYTIVDIERCYTLYTSVKYILRNNIPGDFVECGVMRGGSMMMVAFMLLKAKDTTRNLFLYDTFAGMPEPGEMDGAFERQEWIRMQNTDGGNDWCFAPIEDVQTNMQLTGYPIEKIRLIKGKVEDTIPASIPEKIALLRLDTDWYESTKHELIHLFPILEKSGVLIIDDYGAWPGAKKATDEYFAEKNSVFLNRIDYTGRLLIK